MCGSHVQEHFIHLVVFLAREMYAKRMDYVTIQMFLMTEDLGRCIEGLVRIGRGLMLLARQMFAFPVSYIALSASKTTHCIRKRIY
jgi:hypothetical protein